MFREINTPVSDTLRPAAFETQHFQTVKRTGDYQIYRNPWCTNIDWVNDNIAVLESSAGRPVSIHDTVPDLKVMRELIDTHDENDVIVAYGGDYTQGLILSAAGNHLVANMGGGNADDIAHMLHRNKYLQHPLRLLSDAQPAAMHHLDVSIRHETEDMPQEYQADGYFAVGYSAKMTEWLNDPGVREYLHGKSKYVRLYHEAQEIRRELPDATEFTVTDKKHGSRRRIEVTFANGQRMAKVTRFREHILSDTAQRLEVKKPTVPRILAGVGRAALGATTTVSFEPQSFEIDTAVPILGQINGEPFGIKAGKSFVQVGVSEQTTRVLTTRSLR